MDRTLELTMRPHPSLTSPATAPASTNVDASTSVGRPPTSNSTFPASGASAPNAIVRPLILVPYSASPVLIKSEGVAAFAKQMGTPQDTQTPTALLQNPNTTSQPVQLALHNRQALVMRWLHKPKGVSVEELQLLNEIEYLLQPYLDSYKKPPLSHEQVFVVALVFNPGATLQVAIRWIIDNLSFYRGMVAEEYVSGRGYTCDGADSMFSKLEAVINSFDVPIISVLGKDAAGYEKKVFYVAANEARIFLGSFLHSRAMVKFRNKPFPFMRLPPELRVRIYEMALGFPKSGISVARKGRKPIVSLVTRNYDLERSPAIWKNVLHGKYHYSYERIPQVLKGRTLGDYLSLLRTSKQIYRESMPVFYSTNAFICSDICDLWELLGRTSEARKKHIRHITFSHLPGRHHPTKMVNDAFKQLKALKKLRSLDIIISKDEWLNVRKRDGEQKYEDMTKIPGMPILRSMRGLEKVVIHEDENLVSSFLVPEVTQSVAEPVKKKAGGKKRKAGGDGDGAEASSTSTSEQKQSKKTKAA